MKNRVREAAATLQRPNLDRAVRDAVAADLDRVLRYFEEPSRLPPARGIALFACRTLDLFDVLPLPHVQDRKSTRLNSSHLGISYAVFCLKKKRTQTEPCHRPNHHAK